jgi:hypothetical protein
VVEIEEKYEGKKSRKGGNTRKEKRNTGPSFFLRSY